MQYTWTHCEKLLLNFKTAGNWAEIRNRDPGPTEHESALLTATKTGTLEKASFYLQHPRSTVCWSLDYILFLKEDEMSNRHSVRGCGPRATKVDNSKALHLIGTKCT